MLSELNCADKVVGAKQAKRALRDGKARRVYLAMDVDPRVTEPIAELCAQQSVPVTEEPKMRDLGIACGISVGAAVVAAL